MADPFAAALNVLFLARAIPATYTPVGGPATPLSVIHYQGDVVEHLSGTPIVQAGNVFEIRVSELTTPEHDAMITVAAGDFALFGEPVLDKEGLSWFCGAEQLA